jgi:hypothetical protein
MAFTAVTPATIVRESVGSLTMHIATFAAGGSSSWNSGLPNAIAYWANCGSGEGVGVVAIQTNNSAGVSFNMTGGGGAEVADDIYTLYVLSRT